MNILALGGSGDMGRMAVAILLESTNVSSITIADKSYERAKNFIELVGSDKLEAVELDVTKQIKLTSLLSSYDLIMNTVGPFYKYGTMILDAAIRAQIPYVDICDDWKPTLDLLEMNSRAKEAGITALIGIGASPGITNLMAVIACSRLDKVDDLITAWGYGLGERVGSKPKYFIEPREFYKKFKDTYVCHIGHPEPVTLPRVLNANSVSNLMYMGKTITNVVRKYTQQILDMEISVSEASIKFTEEVRTLNRDENVIKEFIGMPPGLSVIATGIKDGTRKKVAIANNHVPYGAMAGVTSVPLALAAEMILNEEIKEKGVFTPEEAISDTMDFFNRYAKYCGDNLTGEDVLLIRELEI